MRRGSLFVLTMMILGVAMLLRTFFGGKQDGKENDIIQNSGTGFMLQIISSRDSTRLVSKNLQENHDSVNKNYDEISLVMPKYFYNSGRESFVKDLYDSRNVYLRFVFIDDLDWYRDELIKGDSLESDLFLVPYDWMDKISIKNFYIQDEISSKFDQFVQPLVNGKHFPFLPFAVDPMVMYAISGYSSQNNFYEISEYVSNRETVVPLSFPLFFGIASEDLDNRGFVWEYQSIVWYALMHYFSMYRDEDGLGMWIDSNVTQRYNVDNLNMILNIIKIPECKYFPSICFQVYKFIGLRFGFLSDADIVDTYFPSKKSRFDNLSRISVPFFKSESPVRIRGWSMLNSLDDYKVGFINEFVEQYLDKYDEYDLRNSTLSVFKKEDDGLGLLDNEYIGLKGYILNSGGDYINSLRNMPDFWDLLNYKILAVEYLK